MTPSTPKTLSTHPKSTVEQRVGRVVQYIGWGILVAFALPSLVAIVMIFRSPSGPDVGAIVLPVMLGIAVLTLVVGLAGRGVVAIGRSIEQGHTPGLARRVAVALLLASNVFTAVCTGLYQRSGNVPIAFALPLTIALASAVPSVLLAQSWLSTRSPTGGAAHFRHALPYALFLLPLGVFALGRALGPWSEW